MLAAEQRAGAKSAIEAGTKVLIDIISAKGLSYDEFILTI